MFEPLIFDCNMVDTHSIVEILDSAEWASSQIFSLFTYFPQVLYVYLIHPKHSGIIITSNTYNVSICSGLRKILSGYPFFPKQCTCLLLHYSFLYIIYLTLCMLGKNFSRQYLEIFFFNFSYKIEFDTSCKLSPKETICMKCQILFSMKNKKNITSLSSAESALSVVSVKLREKGLVEATFNA